MPFLLGIVFIVFSLYVLFAVQKEQAQQPEVTPEEKEALKAIAIKEPGFFDSFSCKVGLCGAAMTLLVYLIVYILSFFKASPAHGFFVGVLGGALILLTVYIVLPILIIGIISAGVEISRGDSPYALVGLILNIAIAGVLATEYLYRHGLI